MNEIIDRALDTDSTAQKAEYCNDIRKWIKRVKNLNPALRIIPLRRAPMFHSELLKSLAENNSENIDDTLIETKSELQQIYESSKINFSKYILKR